MANLNLGNVCSKIGSGATPRGGKSSYLEDGPVALIRSQNVYNHGFETTGLAFINEDQARRLDGVNVLAGDVLINITGDSVARVCLAPTWLGPARVNQHVAIVRPDPNQLDPKFLRYYLVTPRSQEYLLALASVGATRNALTKGMLEELEIVAPDISEQREIAAILGALDDKIELNRKTAATLEEMARALYKSWFVDFDPVVAKSEGRQPSFMNADTAPLFPDSFGDDGLPEGWSVKPFSEEVSIISGGTPKTKIDEYWGGNIPWYSVVDAPALGEVFVIKTEKTITELGFEKCSAKMVSKGKTIISARGTVGKVAMAGSDMVFNQSCYGLSGQRSNADAFIYFSTLQAVQELQSMAHGSVFETITKKTFEGLSIVTPSDKVLQAFERAVSSFLNRIHGLLVENQTLADLRDTLLPKLMSGELRVGEAKEQVEDVA